ncbi:nitrate reductase [NAD(P)H] [Lolium perenne]|uniref:nitrate reductase [NAD(P)H] n=1 Tax=Lolium perenne TaxID=4522 RepID=UPI0021EB00AB|nr:nitrate reductase [NAD(P)H] [Lolium perenne]
MAASVDYKRQVSTHPWPSNAQPKGAFDLFSSSNSGGRRRPGPDSDSDDEDSIPPDWRSLYSPRLDVEPSVKDPRDEATSDAWVKRHPALVRLTGKHPFNSEPPLPRLMSHGFITPAPLHYVRNHGAVPKADWSTWTIEVTGLVKRPCRITMEQLATEFEAVELPVTLVCAGNRRKEQNMVRQSAGFNWGPGAVSTSVWRGARLRDVLRRCRVMGEAAGADNVCFEGAEDLPGGGGCKYGTSLRRAVAMDPARDVILAYMQNGEPLAPDHGFPVRLIVPGFIGGRMVKWVKRILVACNESESYYHYRDNRVLPSHVDAELANAEAWWYKPECMINELNINSVIATPGHDEVLPINALTTQKPYTMKGYAYSGGGRKVTRVEVTLDGGETWQVCDLDHPERPTKYGKYWCWCFWSVDVEVLDLMGAKEIAVRAWDEALNTQPEKLIWNLMGMMNNCWFRVKINVCRPHKGEIGLVFEHPTQPGNQSGGWMARQKHIQTTSETTQGTLKRSTSTPFMATASTQYTMSEVRRHASKESAWIVVHGHVYDCTGFLKDHPGGADSILINAGSDCTEEFDAIHSAKARGLLEMYRVGELVVTGPDYVSPQSSHADLTAIVEAPPSAPEAPPVSTVALSNPREKVPCRLVGKKNVSDNVRLFRLALPSPDQKLGLPVGKHVYVCASIGGKLCMRAYTPTSSVEEVGHVELLIKIYFKDEDPKFPAGGLLSQYLDSLPLGAPVSIKGPVGHIEYNGRGSFTVGGERRSARRLAMVAGGTGITPVYQVIQAVLRDQPDDDTEMHLVYANRTEDDMLLRAEIDAWAAAHPARLKVWYVVSKVARPEDGWAYGVGRVDEGVLREHLPLGGDGETLALVCGPPAMLECTVRPGLEKMGYDLDKDCLVF